MSDFRVAVRRTNEWDGPSMLKIYTPYVEKTHYTPDTEVPTLAEYVQRIDTYTYGRMWILTEINNQTAGFCFLTDRDIPKDDLFSADAQLYVSEKCLHSGVGTSLYSLMLDIMHHANYRRVTNAKRFTKAYLILAQDYEAAREHAATFVKEGTVV